MGSVPWITRSWACPRLVLHDPHRHHAYDFSSRASKHTVPLAIMSPTPYLFAIAMKDASFLPCVDLTDHVEPLSIVVNLLCSPMISLANVFSGCFACDIPVFPATQRWRSFHMKTAHWIYRWLPSLANTTEACKPCCRFSYCTAGPKLKGDQAQSSGVLHD